MFLKMLKHFYSECMKLMKSIQGHSKVFTTGQAKINPEHYVIKCIDRQ